MAKYTPHPWNQQIIDHILEIPRCGEWAGMGTGKTGSTLTALQILQDLVDSRPYLVLAPKRVASYTWPRETRKWDHIQGDTAVILGSAADRMAALRGGLRSGNAARFTINYENIPWLIDTLADLKMDWPFATVVADESTKLKSFRLRQGGARAQALSKVAPFADRFIELTGTPSPNGYQDLWGQLWFLDYGKRLGRSYSAYMNRWFKKGYDGFSWSIMEHSPAEIEDRLRDICLSVTVPVDLPVVNEIKVELPGKIRDMYRSMEKEAFVQLGDLSEIDAVHAAAKTNKLLQICAGAIYDDDKRVHHLHDAKIEVLESIVAEAAGMPVLVAINFKFEAPMILKAFGKQARILDTNQDLDDWNAGKIPVGIAHPASLGHGIDLQDGGNILAFYSGDWNLEYHDQIVERIGPMRQKQSGYDRPVYLHYILAEGTMDEVVYDRRVNKRTVQEALMLAMKARGL